jgi:hypothetical protein
MSTPTALDRIAASLHDLAHALKHPTTGSPLAPINSSQVAALDNLIQLFTAIRPRDTEPTLDPVPDNTPSPNAALHLRVETKKLVVDADPPVTYRTATKRKPRTRTPMEEAAPKRSHFGNESHLTTHTNNK